jgi:hypothetical protein
MLFCGSHRLHLDGLKAAPRRSKADLLLVLRLRPH